MTQQTNPEQTNPELQGQQQQQTQEPTQKNEKTLTQEEVNAIVQGKVNKLKDKYKDYDELARKVAEFDKAQKEKADAELSELERAQKALEEKEGSLSAMQKQIEEMNKANEARAIRTAFENAARKVNIEYVNDAFNLADLSAVKVEGDKVEGIEDIVAGLVESKPFLLAKKQQQSIGGASNGQSGAQHQVSNEDLLKAAAEKARKTGRLEDRVAYAHLKRELSK